MFWVLFVAVACASLSFLLCTGVLTGRLVSPYSIPGERSLHGRPVARGGGLGIAAGVLFGAVVLIPQWQIPLALTLMWMVSAWDDWSDASPTLRLAVHSLSAMLVVAAWGEGGLSTIVAIPLIIVVIWSVNLFNFIDGVDGVAASAAIIGGTALATIAVFLPGTDAARPASMALIGSAVVVAASALGFLPMNLPPARLFMGDGGSTVLGLALAAVSIKGVADGVWQAAVPLAIFMPLWADATYTLVRRLLRGHNPLRPHREHLYQRLTLAGLGHRGVLFWIVGWMLLSIAVAGLVRSLAVPLATAAVTAYAAFYVVLTEWTLRRQPNLLMNPRAFLALLYDVAAAASAWALLFWARFNFNIDGAEFTAGDVARSLAFVVPVHALVFVGLGLYEGLWRFASMADLRRIVLGAFVAAASTAVLFVIVRPDSFIWPRSVLLLQPALLILLMGGARFAYRSWKEHRLYGLAAAQGEPVLVLGAGAAGARLVSELSRSDTWQVVALLDDDMTKVGARVHDTPVVGRLAQAEDVARRFGARHAIIAMPNTTHEARRRAVEIAASAGLSVLTVPSYDELLSEESPLAKLRAIELEDLLGRDPVVLDNPGLASWISGRTVLVTGAGGSIGTELCNQVARFHPGRLVMVDISEFASHVVGEHIATKLPRERIEVYVGNARNRERMLEIFERERPHIVFHAAAYKHVPLTETVNAWEAVRNNVLGTLVAAECARAVAAEKFVLISTDKAVRPSSIMGASKRLAELAIMSLPETPTKFVGVRFGNVLGSNGSVIPKFREQIASGGPVTVTHPEMTRYFMSIPEAAQLVLQAGLMGHPQSLFVLDMGRPVLIVELARELIRLARGSTNAIPIVYTGLRPGEKMHEELTGDGEQFLPTAHAKVRRVVASLDAAIDIDELLRWLDQPSPYDVRAELKRWVIDFSPPAPPAALSTILPPQPA